MKTSKTKHVAFLFLLLSFLSVKTQAQINCNAGQFYGVGNGTGGLGEVVYSLTLSGNTVTLGSTITNQFASSLFGLAIANLSGSGDTLYSTGSGHTILKYDGTTWQTIYTATNNVLDGAGKNSYLYFHNLHIPNFGSQWQNRIDRFTGSSLIALWNDTIMFTAVADLAVDNNGNICFFTGATQFTVDTLRIMSPTGIFLNSIPVSFDPSNAYGLFLLDSTLYVGLGATNLTNPNSLLPITVSANSAIVGTPIPVPHPQIGVTTNGSPIYLEFSDLESCASAQIPLGITEHQNHNEINIFPNPVSDILNINLPKCNNTVANIYDAMGRIIFSRQINTSNIVIDFSKQANGIYIAEIISSNKIYYHKLIKN